MPAEIVFGWKPVLLVPLPILFGAWAAAMAVQLRRPVTPTEVMAALEAPPPLDVGVEPAVARWRAVLPAFRFCPPGIDPRRVTETDVRMWLKVGCILERNSY